MIIRELLVLLQQRDPQAGVFLLAGERKVVCTNVSDGHEVVGQFIPGRPFADSDDRLAVLLQATVDRCPVSPNIYVRRAPDDYLALQTANAVTKLGCRVISVTFTPVGWHVWFEVPNEVDISTINPAIAETMKD